MGRLIGEWVVVLGGDGCDLYDLCCEHLFGDVVDGHGEGGEWTAMSRFVL